MEYWKIIENYPEYQVSTHGNVKKTKTDRILKQSLRNGYKKVSLSQNCESKTLDIHRLVCEAFCDNPNNYNIVDHINHNKLDNHFSNLRFCTPQENTRNRRIFKNNTTGVTGVYKTKDKWQASIVINGKSKNVGYYKTFEEAKEARLKKEKEIFKEFSPN